MSNLFVVITVTVGVCLCLFLITDCAKHNYNADPWVNQAPQPKEPK